MDSLVAGFGLIFLLWLIWYFSVRATGVMAAILAGFVAHDLGAHWITIVLCAIGGWIVMYWVIGELRDYIDTVPVAYWTFFLLVCTPPFALGFLVVQLIMRGAGNLESWIISSIAGVALATVSFKKALVKSD